MPKRTLTPEERIRLAALYRDHSSREVARIMGVCSTTVNNWARSMGASHSPACKARLKAEAAERMVRVAKEHHRQAIATRQRHRRADELRWLGGQEPLRGFRFPHLTRRARNAKGNICYRRGYRCKPGDTRVLLYDASTRRSPKVEAMYAEKYGLSFEEAKGSEE